MDNIGLELLIIVGLSLLNGFFAMAETAIVSARRTRLSELASDGNRGAKAALRLKEHPERLLSTVQLGITLIGILAGVFGGATIAAKIEPSIAPLPWIGVFSAPIALGLVVVIITYISIVIGELVPKRLAIAYPNRIAARVAPTMRVLARVLRPLVWILEASSRVVLLPFRVQRHGPTKMSEDEIKLILAQGAEQGVVAEEEQDIASRALHLADRRIDSLMTPRRQVIWLDKDDDGLTVRERVSSTGHSYYPVCDGSIDRIVGVLKTSDLIALRDSEVTGAEAGRWRSMIREALCVPSSTNIIRLLERLREGRARFALVIDEYGGLDGIVTLHDVLEAIVGQVPHDVAPEEQITRRDDGSLLVDAALSLVEFEHQTGVSLEDQAQGDYQTLAGFVLARLGHLPRVGERIELEELSIEVVDMDGMRLDKLLIYLKSNGDEEEEEA